MDTLVKHQNTTVDTSLFRPWDCRQENQNQELVKGISKKDISCEKPLKSQSIPISNPSKSSSSQSNMVISTENSKCSKAQPLLPKSTEALSYPTAAAFAINHSRSPANLLSLMTSTGQQYNHHHQQAMAPCYPNGSKYPPLIAPNMASNLNPLKSASQQRCQQPMSFPALVPESGFLAPGFVPTNSSGLFSFPNLFAYNAFNAAAAAAFHSASHHHHQSHQQHHLETLMTATNKALALSSSSANSANELQKLAIEQQQHQNSLLERTPKKQRPKRFQCPHCQVSFSNNGQLKGHIRIHTGRCQFTLQLIARFTRKDVLINDIMC